MTIIDIPTEMAVAFAQAERDRVEEKHMHTRQDARDVATEDSGFELRRRDSYAAYHVSASEYLRMATEEGRKKDSRLAILRLAADAAEQGVLVGENALKRMLAMAQYQAAMAMILVVTNEIETERIH